ncbi:unnamed protein product [Fraxinus pennsylvanica]|uniref:Reverse transcriptase n=1 Tax=Fraxinus pennsylvanica TaxID=56036 RepID=A0AAD1YPA8_9LAMI|nr:unnamed protein product [Fraxinus pennsylvanica]
MQDLEDVVGKIRMRLASWQSRVLSKGARLLLLRHVLSSMPPHLFSCIKAPASVLKVINRIFSDFFWGYADGKPKRKWIAWDKVCMPVKEGRARLHSLHEVQLSWKILTETSLWSKIFRAKYIKDKHISQVDATKGSRFWKIVMSCMPMFLNGLDGE